MTESAYDHLLDVPTLSGDCTHCSHGVTVCPLMCKTVGTTCEQCFVHFHHQCSSAVGLGVEKYLSLIHISEPTRPY